jgi:hypothetical protein
MMKGKKQKIAIVMDEIDGMNSGDKGGITSLIKLIRQKKTKKQRLEHVTLNPIICIGNYFVDKKIKELMKVCHTFELRCPDKPQVHTMITRLMPNIRDPDLFGDIQNYVQSDMRKLAFLSSIYVKKPGVITSEMIRTIFHTKSHNDDSKRIIQKLFEAPVSIKDHNSFMNETDRTTVALLWHENVVDKLERLPKKAAFPFYLDILKNMCFADYTDRITFQNQIWQFNEMSSLIKTFKNNKMYHEFSKNNKGLKGKQCNLDEIRFTKVLTKYSTEYNNSLFIQKLCQKLGMDKKDLFGFFVHLKNNKSDAEIINLLENYEIYKLDINRMYRYIEKYITENASGTADKEIEEEYEDVGEDCFEDE